MKTIGGPWGRSVLGPVREHMGKVTDCLDIFSRAIREFVKGNHSCLEKLSREVTEAENAADMIKNGIRDSFSRSIFASGARSDVLVMIHRQDDISDACEDVVKLLTLRKVDVPKELRKLLISLAHEVRDSVRSLEQAVRILSEAEESEQAAHKKTAGELLDSVTKREWESDRIELEFARQLLGEEQKLDPISVFYLMQLGRTVSSIADCAENSADCLRQMLH